MSEPVPLNKANVRAIWWSMFWRYFLYTQVAFAVLSVVLGSQTLRGIIREHTVFVNAIQGGLEGLASMIALTQALKIRVPSLLSREDYKMSARLGEQP
jgi:hypothetical protein